CARGCAVRPLATGALLEHVPERLLAPATGLRRAGELARREAVERRHREVVNVARVGRERDRREEADEKPDLVPLVKLSPTREVGGDAPFREGVQEGRRVRIVADEDGEVAVAPASGEPLAGDALGDLIGFQRARG